MTMLEKLKSRLSISSTDTSKDVLLQGVLDVVIEYAKQYTHNEDIDDVCELTIIEMAVIVYNKNGAEGLNSESYSGVNFNYAEDFPAIIYKALQSNRKIQVVQ